MAFPTVSSDSVASDSVVSDSVVSDSPEWVTLAQVESPCEAVQLPGWFTDGETVPCPYGDHEHVLAHTIQVEVVPSMTIGNTICLFPRH